MPWREEKACLAPGPWESKRRARGVGAPSTLPTLSRAAPELFGVFRHSPGHARSTRGTHKPLLLSALWVVVADTGDCLCIRVGALVGPLVGVFAAYMLRNDPAQPAPIINVPQQATPAVTVNPILQLPAPADQAKTTKTP